MDAVDRACRLHDLANWMLWRGHTGVEPLACASDLGPRQQWGGVGLGRSMANLRAATAEEGRAQFFVYAQTMNILFGVTRAALEIHREGQAEKYMKSLYVIEGATADNGPAWNHGWIGWKLPPLK